ncbi:MAG TPA: alpha/beta fold hydrolase [Rhizomicrobium sp.]
MAIFQFGLQSSAPRDAKARLADLRWSLSAIDPRAHLRYGTFAASDGADVPYRLWRAHHPRAQLLLLHGACDYSGAFDEIAPRLARRGFTSLAIDQRGFGATQSRGRWTSLERMVDDIADAAGFLRNRTGATLPLFVIGESMGGAVAVHAAAKFPNLDLAGLVLVAPGALASAVKRMFYHLLARVTRALTGDSEVVFERISGWELSPASAIRLLGDPLVMRAIKAEQFEGLVNLGYSAVSEAAKVTTPVLTLVAGKDDLLSQNSIRRLHDNFAGDKTWNLVLDGPHLLLHWKRGDVVLREARHWINNRLMMPSPADSDAGSGSGPPSTAPDSPDRRSDPTQACAAG